MYLSVDSGRPRPEVLVEPDDFALFKVMASARSWGELSRALGAASDRDRTAGLEAMLEQAGCKGWPDAAQSAPTANGRSACRDRGNA